MRSVSLALVLVSLGVLTMGTASSATAQTGALRPFDALRPSSSEFRALELLAGPRARVVIDPDGVTLRTLAGASMAPSRASFEEGALACIDRFGPLFGLPPGATFVVQRVVSTHGFSIAHIARTIDHREVELASILVRARPDGLIDLVHVDAMPRAIAPWPAAPDIAAARAAGLEAPRYAAPRALGTREVSLSLGGALRPALEVEVSGSATERARVYVDPASAEVLLVLPLVLDVMGRVYANNPTTDRAMPVDLELTDLTSRDHLTGRHARVQSCDQSAPDCPTIQHAVADASGDFLFMPMPRAYDDAFAEVSAYHHATRVIDYMATAHSFVWSCGGSETINLLVNYTQAMNTPYDNAAFTPGGRGGCGFLLFGQGRSDDFAYDGDVIYHEFGHAVTDAVTDLGFFGSGNSPNYDPLAINEGTSDYWAGAVQGNPELAESIMGLEGARGLRTMANSLRCPYDLIGEGHEDGRLWSGLGWDTHLAIGQERADRLMFVAVASTTGSASLTDATTNLLATAMSYEMMGTLTGAERAMIEAAATARGLDACGHVIPLDDGHVHEGYSGNEFVTAALARGLAPIQYSIEIPADTVSVEVDIEHVTPAGQVTLHLTSGLPPRSSATRISSMVQLPIGHAGTARLDVEGGLVPCQRLYIGVETTDIRTAGQSLYAISARLNTTGDPTATCPMDPPDAGAAADASSEADAGPADAGSVTPPAGAGCGCRANAGPGPSGALSLAGLALALARARRRR